LLHYTRSRPRMEGHKIRAPREGGALKWSQQSCVLEGTPLCFLFDFDVRRITSQPTCRGFPPLRWLCPEGSRGQDPRRSGPRKPYHGGARRLAGSHLDQLGSTFPDTRRNGTTGLGSVTPAGPLNPTLVTIT
jgi:hypothetical protein